MRRLGQRQSGHVQPRRGNARLVPRSGQLQCGRANPAAQGEGLASTAGRSARTSIATAAASSPERSRIAKVLDALKVPASGYYDQPDPYRDGAARVESADALRQSRDDAWYDGSTLMCHWHRPRVEPCWCCLAKRRRCRSPPPLPPRPRRSSARSFALRWSN